MIVDPEAEGESREDWIDSEGDAERVEVPSFAFGGTSVSWRDLRLTRRGLVACDSYASRTASSSSESSSVVASRALEVLTLFLDSRSGRVGLATRLG